uniref:Uncharacterized protein n=1 Tax=Megaselia scalaris TaxID=36166 RepID=T1GS78_MEGSC
MEDKGGTSMCSYGLIVNGDKTKYMLSSRRQKSHIQLGSQHGKVQHRGCEQFRLPGVRSHF